MLVPTGRQVDTTTSINSQAKDEDGLAVTVIATLEAMDDYGPEACWDVAERKYDEGDFEDTGTVRLVRVFTKDFDEPQSE